MLVSHARRTRTQVMFTCFGRLLCKGATSKDKSLSLLTDKRPEFRTKINQCCSKLTIQSTIIKLSAQQASYFEFIGSVLCNKYQHRSTQRFFQHQQQRDLQYMKYIRKQKPSQPIANKCCQGEDREKKNDQTRKGVATRKSNENEKRLPVQLGHLSIFAFTWMHVQV